MNLLLTPPLAFLAYVPLVLLLLGLGRLLAGPASANAVKSSIYGSGEASPTFEAAPGYQPFFLIALFFAVVHLAMLVVAIGRLPAAAAVYLGGLFVALVALILG
jgi:NADH:ubiquinone oxidoreductase subunit 3 (subunit A)